MVASKEHFDLVLVGAGISAIGVAHHLLERCPGKRFVMLEAKETFGGTWDTHRYPGIRSDSDLYTFGYGFKPWTGAPVAHGSRILDYLGEVIADDDLERFIRYGHRIEAAHWSSADQRWTLDVLEAASGERITITCKFFVWTGGYYDHQTGYTPEWPGFEDFEGEVIHPQHWPEDVDLSGRRVVVIGSGATAATLIPNIADDCAHVTMLQRSPTYFWTGENRNDLADRLRALDLPDDWVHEIVRRDLLKTQRELQYAAEQYPDHVKEELLSGVRAHIGDDLTREHFTPTYRPWQQRLAYVPDADLFEAISAGKASVVTDHIARFTAGGIELESGEHLEADVVITATGFNALTVGGIQCTFDGQELDPADTFTYRGLMLSGFPNFLFVFGYLRTSWTMRVDLVGQFLCRLLEHMDAHHSDVVMPTLREDDAGMARKPWIAEDVFNPGYMKRAMHRMPASGDRDPWNFSPDYYVEKKKLPAIDLDEDVLRYLGGASS